jgi:hypothetical protein
MGKRGVDNDATQDVSASQLVPDAKPPPVYGNVPKNDASMWMQQPVSADDFVSAPRKKPVAPSSGGRGFVVALIVIALIATTGAGVWFAFLRDKPKQLSALEGAGSGSATAGSATAPAVAIDAAVAVATTETGDAGTQATAPSDAGAAKPAVAMIEGLGEVDAVSGADPAKKATKKRPATKKGAKKKTATRAKKKR